MKTEYEVLSGSDLEALVRSMDTLAEMGWRLVSTSCVPIYGIERSVTHFLWMQREI